MVVLYFLAGFICGTLFGVIVMGLMFTAKYRDMPGLNDVKGDYD